jgi:DNA-binding response OmpR family regulator
MVRILIVDDERDNAYVFALILEDQGYLVDTYSDPIKALAEFKVDYYDMMILDYRMARLNGVELYQKIRQLDNSAKVILLTAAHEQLQIDGNHKIKVLGKPISGTELLQEVEFVLKQEEDQPDLMTPRS